jgi:hypothetical protein
VVICKGGMAARWDASVVYCGRLDTACVTHQQPFPSSSFCYLMMYYFDDGDCSFFI